MKGLLDRLMARQMRLLASLDQASDTTRTPPTSPDPATEAAALDAATAHLASGDLRLAREALEPFIESGRNVQTLTTLARVCTDQGDMDHALAALQRAEAIDPGDRKVWRLMAKLLSTQRRFREEVVYRRRLALAGPEASAQALVDLLRALLHSVDKKGKQASAPELRLVLSRFEAASDVDDRLRLKFAELYYLLSSGSADAVRHYNASVPSKLDERDITARLMSLTAWSSQQRLPMPRLNDEGLQGRRPTLHELKDVQVHPSLGWIPVLEGGSVLASGYAMERHLYRSVTPRSPLMLYRGSHAELRLPRDLAFESRPALLVGGSDSFYDNVTAHAAGLAVAERVGFDRSLPLVVGDGALPWLDELLELLGYTENPRIRVPADQPRHFARLHVPSRLAVGAEWIDPLLARWYRERLAPLHAAPRKLYVVAGSVGPVAIDNEAAVADILVRLGYETINPQALDLREAIKAFAGATHIVGATSEGMTPLVFAAPGTRVLELRAVHWVASGGRMHFDRLAEACEHQYNSIECPLAAADGLGATSVVVDVDRLGATLEAIP